MDFWDHNYAKRKIDLTKKKEKRMNKNGVGIL